MHQAQALKKSLTTEYIDFWLLGGASLFVWLVMISLGGFRGSVSSIDMHYGNIISMAVTLSLICNYPHFMASYKIAYGKGLKFIVQHWVHLLLVPISLIFCFALAYFNYVGGGEVLMGYIVNIMFFTVGWHYTGQAFGCMMVYAKFNDYKISKRQRLIIRISLNSIWALSMISAGAYATGESQLFHGVPYRLDTIPKFVLALSYLVTGLSFLAFLFFVVRINYQQDNKKPPVNFLVPYLAMHIWWVPLFYQDVFYSQVVPFFHSLQYLPFVYAIEKGKILDGKLTSAQGQFRATSIIILLVTAGYLSFELIPQLLDTKTYTQNILGAPFFFVCFTLFINIHHYFIDNVTWKFHDKDLKRYIFKTES